MEPFLCLGANEIANGVRVMTYGAHKLFQPCPCEAMDEDFTDPATDDAPWYDPEHPESVDFLGFLPSDVTVFEVGQRPSVQLAALGASVGSYHLQGRIVEVRGWMIALDEQALYWGKRWLVDALKGSPCDEGCAADDLTVLPFCRDSDDPYDPVSGDFRTLMGTGLVARPAFTPLLSDECFAIETVQFQLASSMPWLYRPPTRCLEDEVLSGPVNCALTTSEWVEGGTFRIVIENTGTTQATGITITGRISLDESCPVDAPGTSVPVSFTYTIPVLGPHDVLTIDGARRQVTYRDASAKVASAGLPFVDFDGPWIWPDVGFCTTVCLEITGYDGTVTATVDAYLREA